MSGSRGESEALLLDTCVWRDAVAHRSWLRAQADAGRPIAACPESVEELAVSAITARSDATFEEARCACVLVARYADVLLPPFHWHLAQELGFDLGSLPGAVPNPIWVCKFVGECRTRQQLLDRADEMVDVGGGQQVAVLEWPDVMRREKTHWRDSIRSAIEGAVPGLTTARQEGRHERIDRQGYEVLKGRILGDRLAHSRMELERMRVNLSEDLEVEWGDPALLLRIDEKLDVFARAFAEAVLDLFDGPHNGPTPVGCNEMMSSFGGEGRRVLGSAA